MVGPALLLAVGDGNTLAELAVALLNPLMHEPFYKAAAPSPMFLLSTALWGGLSIQVFRRTERRIADHVPR